MSHHPRQTGGYGTSTPLGWAGRRAGTGRGPRARMARAGSAGQECAEGCRDEGSMSHSGSKTGGYGTSTLWGWAGRRAGRRAGTGRGPRARMARAGSAGQECAEGCRDEGSMSHSGSKTGGYGTSTPRGVGWGRTAGDVVVLPVVVLEWHGRLLGRRCPRSRALGRSLPGHGRCGVYRIAITDST
jgi:hypothetical protein